MKKHIFILLLLLPTCVSAEEITAVLDMKFIKDTGETAATLCFGDDEKDCAQWATFYLYEAKVQKVLSGKLPSKKIKAIYGRHALMPKNFNNVAVVLAPLTDHKEAEYQIQKWGELKEMYCFKGDVHPKNVSDENAKQQLKCYDIE